MIVAKLLMYGLSDEENFLVPFYFNINEVQAVFVADEQYLSIVLSGQIHELEYSQNIFDEIKSTLALKTLRLN